MDLKKAEDRTKYRHSRTVKHLLSRALKRTRKASILVIEPDALGAMELCSQLSDLGHRIVGVAITAASALDLALETAPDVVVTSNDVPDQKAVMKAIDEIRHVWPDLLVILMVDEGAALNPLAPYVTVQRKPCSGKELSKTVMGLLAA